MKKMRSDLTLKGSDIFLIGSAIGYGLKIQSNEDSDPHLFLLCLLQRILHIVFVEILLSPEIKTFGLESTIGDIFSKIEVVPQI